MTMYVTSLKRSASKNAVYSKWNVFQFALQIFEKYVDIEKYRSQSQQCFSILWLYAIRRRPKHYLLSTTTFLPSTTKSNEYDCLSVFSSDRLFVLSSDRLLCLDLLTQKLKKLKLLKLACFCCSCQTFFLFYSKGRNVGPKLFQRTIKKYGTIFK